MNLLERFNLTFDADDNTTISKEKLKRLIAMAKSEKTFSDDTIFPEYCYVLVDRNGVDFYPFPITEFEEWQKDGSFEKGDYLYKMNLHKKY